MFGLSYPMPVFQCHGPDKAKRKATLHFDTEEGARADLGGYSAIVPGKPDRSEMIKQLITTDRSKLLCRRRPLPAP